MSNNVPESLRALAESKAEGITKTTTFRVDPNLIHLEPGFNLRVEGDELDLHIERLYQSIKAGAFIPPVDVKIKDGLIVARDGHCRTKAAQRVREEIPEFTLECRQLRGNDADEVLHMLGTGSGQKPLTPLEQGRGYLRLITMGLKIADIAGRLGVSRVTVENNLVLAEAPIEVQQMISDGEISSTQAREVIKQGEEAVTAMKEVVKAERAKPASDKKKKKITAKKLKGTKAEKKAKKGKKPKSKAPTPEGFISLSLNRETASVLQSFASAYTGAGSPEELACLMELAGLIETALM